jgi:hypothetical protein
VLISATSSSRRRARVTPTNPFCFLLPFFFFSFLLLFIWSRRHLIRCIRRRLFRVSVACGGGRLTDFSTPLACLGWPLSPSLPPSLLSPGHSTLSPTTRKMTFGLAAPVFFTVRELPPRAVRLHDSLWTEGRFSLRQGIISVSVAKQAEVCSMWNCRGLSVLP